MFLILLGIMFYFVLGYSIMNYFYPRCQECSFSYTESTYCDNCSNVWCDECANDNIHSYQYRLYDPSRSLYHYAPTEHDGVLNLCSKCQHIELDLGGLFDQTKVILPPNNQYSFTMDGDNPTGVSGVNILASTGDHVIRT